MTDSAFLGTRTTAERSSMDLVHPTAFFSMMGICAFLGRSSGELYPTAFQQYDSAFLGGLRLEEGNSTESPFNGVFGMIGERISGTNSTAKGATRSLVPTAFSASDSAFLRGKAQLESSFFALSTAAFLS